MVELHKDKSVCVCVFIYIHGLIHNKIKKEREIVFL
jgi:hypothetical protein